MTTKMVNVKVNGKWDILLPDHRAARPEWTSEAGWEKARLDHINATTKAGDVVYYVGAEEGDMCGLLAQWGANVVMFEPNPLVWPNVKAIWGANNLKDVYLYDGFASSSDSEDWKSGIKGIDSIEGEMIPDHGFKNLCEADGTIPQVKIDTYSEHTGLIPDMISIDVEGAELEVLKGAEKVIDEHHPRIYLSLHPEFLWQIYEVYSNDLRQWLKNKGYKETLLDYQHEVHLVYEYEK